LSSSLYDGRSYQRGVSANWLGLGKDRRAQSGDGLLLLSSFLFVQDQSLKDVMLSCVPACVAIFSLDSA